MNSYACRKCNRILLDKKCPTCEDSNVSKNWKGLVMIFDSERSLIAKKMKIKNVGNFAIRVR